MKIKLYEIGESSSRYEFSINRTDLVKLEKRFDFEKINCVAEVSKNQESIVIRGTYQVEIKAVCDICLTPATLSLDQAFELNLVQEENHISPGRDIEIHLDSPEVDFYQGEEILLDQYFEDQLLLDLPLTVSCSSDCKGICAKCGANRNLETCNCLEDTGSNPFAVLKDLKPDT